MSFGAPWAFLLLIPVLLLPLQPRWTGRNRLAVGSVASFERRRTARLWLAPLPALLRLCGLALVVVALARPQIVREDVWVESDGLDIVLALDASRSMLADDLRVGLIPTTRLDVAKGVIAEFVQARPNDRLGLVVFGAEAFTHVPLTLDHETFVDMLAQIEVGVAGAGTAIGTGIGVAAKRLKDFETKSKVIILLTDGWSNRGAISPMEAAQAAAALDIKVYTIGIGAARRATDRADEGIDEEGMTAVAETTGGKFFLARDTESLRRVYQTIDQLEPSPAKVLQLVDHVELFRRFLIPGLVLLALDLLLSTTWLRRTP